MVGLTRRRFCAGTALGATLAAAGCDPAVPPARTLSAFTALVGTDFTVEGAGSLKLARVRVHAPPRRSGPRRGEAFTLVFEADRPMALAQAAHPVRHPELGAFSLFLVPRGRPGPAGLPTYAATYCRL